MPDENPGLMTIFGEALEIAEPASRKAYLDRVCGEDVDLRRRVEALLSAHASAGHFLEPDASSKLEAVTVAAPLATGAFSSDAGQSDAMATGDHLPVGATATFEGTRSVGPTTGPAAGTVIAGRYTLLEVIGEGGMGTVYRASQSEPVKRLVALKLIKVGMDSKAVLARFDAERQALALMDHSNIARVYDGGTTSSGQPFFAMEFVNGKPITEYCDSVRLPVRARLELFVAVCQAVQHAHQKGIIHRDLKPGNVLVAEVDGRPTPKVIDFGVAKATEQKLTEMSFADTGAIVGTPQYMSPEQADPTSMDIDTRTDVYALGVILYELLVGSPPVDAKQFKRGAILEMMRMVREVDPPRPSTRLSTSEALPNIAANRNLEPAQLKRALRGDLDWIVMKALEKDRTRRYDTANGFAADVLRHLAYEPVLAAPPGKVYRLRKFVRKNRGAVMAASLVFSMLLFGIVGTTWGLIRAEKARAEEAKRVEERDEAIGKRDVAIDVANARAEELKYRLGVSDMVLAVGAYENNNLQLAAEQLAKVPQEQRGWEWYYLKRQTRGGLFTLYGHAGSVNSVSYSPDGSKIVSGSADKTAKVWDAQTGKPLFDLGGHEGVINSVIYSPDGTKIITCSGDKTAKVWNARTGMLQLELMGHTGSLISISCSLDGTRVVTGSDDKTAKVWDLRTGKPLVDLRLDSAILGCAVISPDGTRIVTTGLDIDIKAKTAKGNLKVWDASTGLYLFDFKTESMFVTSLSFSPDGTRIATSSSTGQNKVWDARTGKPLLELQGQGAIGYCISFSPDGTRIVSGTGSDLAMVWDSRTGRLLLELKGHKDTVNCASFSPDGTKIVTGSRDRTAKVWDSQTGNAVLELQGEVSGPNNSISADGLRIVSCSNGNVAQVWDARTGIPILELIGHTATVWTASFSPDGRQIATGSLDNTARVWDAWTGMTILELKGHTGWVYGVSFSPDGTRIATGSGHVSGNVGEVKVWDARKGEVQLELKTGGVNSVSFSPDGKQILTSGNTTNLWDAQTGVPLLEINESTHPGSFSASFSPDCRRIVTYNCFNSAKIWDSQTGAMLLELKGHKGTVTAASFSPDGRRIVTGGADNTSKVWDARTGTLLLELKGHSRWINSVSFSSDGSRIVTGSADNTVKVWDARSYKTTDDNLRLTTDQITYRTIYTMPNYWRYQQVYTDSRIAGDLTSAQFYLDRILSLTHHRTTERLKERNDLQTDPRLIARSSFHHPALANEPYDHNAIQILAIKGDRLAQRLVAQEFLRNGKPGPAIPMLFTSLVSRPVTEPPAPPVEELLLAQAYLALKQPEEAKRFYRAATEWLDRPLQPIRAANIVSHCALNPWAGIVASVAPVEDLRRNPFDWESWHECDVFRVEVEKGLATR